MAYRTATLYIRITKNGRSSFCKPVYQSKGRLKPQYAMVKREPDPFSFAIQITGHRKASN